MNEAIERVKDLILFLDIYFDNRIDASVSKAIEKHQPKNEIKEEVPELLTRKQVGKLFGICLATVDNWTRQGKLIKHRNGKTVRYKREEVIESLTRIGRRKSD